MNQDTSAKLAAELPEGKVWVRALLELAEPGWRWRYGQVTVGRQPRTWPDESWVYASLAFVAATTNGAGLRGWLTAGSDGRLRLGDFDVTLPRVQQSVQKRHRPSFELRDRDRSPHPSFEYVINHEAGPSASSSTAGQWDFLVGPDSPSFTDLDSAYRAFFLGSYEVPDNVAVPSNLLDVRVIDMRAWLGPIHISATRLTVDVRGSDPGGYNAGVLQPHTSRTHSDRWSSRRQDRTS